MIRLNKSLKLGVATASLQIEGGVLDTNWNDWYNKGMIKDGTNPSRANNHYELYKEDIDLMASMGIECYRMSIEWARLEPALNVFDDEAYEHYIDEINYLKSKGIEVLLTLHHFSNPMWFERLGGFTAKDSSDIFNDFVAYTIKKLGHLVSEYVTVNEPNVYVTSAYFFGEFPPGIKSFEKSRVVFTNLALSHIKAYNTIHRIRRDLGYNDTKVGYSSHVRVFKPKRAWYIVDIIGAKLMEKMFQGSIDKACMTGVFDYPLLKSGTKMKGKYYDFIGLNYYTRSMVKVFEEGANQKSGVVHNDLGWEIYPEGLKILAEKYYKKYKAPIYITENGTCDKYDKIRSKYIVDHLAMIAKTNAPIEKYYHWTFIDNFEWTDGESACFGLVELDYDTQKRTIRESGKLYSQIIKNKVITDEMLELKYK